MINCDFNECTSHCKNYNICNLHLPSNKRLGELRSVIIWDYNRINEINQAINNYNNILYCFHHEELPDLIQEYFSEETVLDKINQLRNEKNNLISELREMQIKEKNIVKILKKRQV